MNFAPVRWIGRNIGTLLLAFALALLVWVSAVLSADPNVECENLPGVGLEILGQAPNLQIVDEIPAEVNINLRAPASICERFVRETGLLRAFIDLSGLSEGQHTVPVNVPEPDVTPVRFLNVSPNEVTLTLESIQIRTLPIIAKVTGEPAPGFSPGALIVDASRVDISGLRSMAEKVAEARVTLNINGAEEDIVRSVPVQLFDEDGNIVTGVNLDPARVEIRQVIERPGNFRDVTVRLVTEGQQAEGYKIDNLSVTPQFVTLFSSDPGVLRDMPGFVETVPLDLTDATDDIERRLSLVLPEGVSVFGGEQTVFVQVTVTAIERSKPFFSQPVEVVGLAQGLVANLSINIVDVIVAGPGPILDLMQPEDLRVVLDLSGLNPGVYSLTPAVEISPVGVRQESVLPTTIEVTIALIPTMTPTPENTTTVEPGGESGTPQPALTPTATSLP